MTKKLNLTIILIILVYGYLSAQNSGTTIFGTNKEYAGKYLEFFSYNERMFDTYEILAKTKVDSAGNFTVTLELSETQLIFCKTLLYKAYIYAEPGKSYQVNLPPSAIKSEENINNPFFSAPLWHMIPTSEPSASKPDLNTSIYEFDKQFDPFLDKQILRYYDLERSRHKLDSFKLAISHFAVPDKNGYFSAYCIYKLACLDFIVKGFSQTDLFERYLKDKLARPDVSSWWEFFNMYFDGYFSSLSLKKEFSQLYSIIGKGSYYELNQLLKTDPALQNDQMREWVLLKEIHNAYYGNNLPLSTYLSLSDSLSATSHDKITVALSKDLRKEVVSLLPGNDPPAALLMNSGGDTMQITSQTRKYSYIGFCSLNSIECQQEFEYLKYFYHKHGKYLNVLIILPETEKDLIRSFTDENTIPWEFWYSIDREQIQKDYKVRAYPVFYLFDRDNKILMSPATLPSAGFEQQLFKILKSKGEI